MPFNTGQGSQLIVPGLRRVMFQAYNERPAEYMDVANTKTSKRNFEEDLEFVGFGTMPAKPEGTATIYTDPIQGEKKRYTHVAFGMGFRITREMMDDDLYNIAQPSKMAKELGKAARNVREIRFANIFNNGFTIADGFPKSGTQQTLFSTTHTLLGGGTFANRPTTEVDLSQAALEAAIISFNTLVDENNIPIVVMPKMLLVNPQLIMVARELLGSEYKPYVASNEINPTREDGLTLKINHYLTDADAWFVGAGKGDHDLNFITRTDLEYQTGDDFDSGDSKQKAFQRFSVGYGDWRGWYGSTGA